MPKSTTFPFGYIRGKIYKMSEVNVPLQSRFVQYGMGIFTGVRGNWNHGKLYLFRLKDHFERLQENAKLTNMKFSMNYEKFKKIIFDLIKKNRANGDIYFRAILYAKTLEMAPRFDDSEYDFAIYMVNLKEYLDTEKGLNVCVSSWRRFDDDMISTKVKIHGGYANSAFAKTEASLNGYEDAIFLNRKGFVCEGTSTNIFGVKNGTIYVPEIAANNLNGLTRRTLIELAKKELKLKVKETKFGQKTLYNFDELFLCGTATKIAWIRSVDKKVIGGGRLGPITSSLNELLNKASYGDLPGYRKWLTEVR